MVGMVGIVRWLAEVRSATSVLLVARKSAGGFVRVYASAGNVRWEGFIRVDSDDVVEDVCEELTGARSESVTVENVGGVCTVRDYTGRHAVVVGQDELAVVAAKVLRRLFQAAHCSVIDEFAGRPVEFGVVTMLRDDSVPLERLISACEVAFAGEVWNGQ